MGKYPGFTEQQAILAAQEKDNKELTAILDQMLPGEIGSLEDAAKFLTEHIAGRRDRGRRYE